MSEHSKRCQYISQKISEILSTVKNRLSWGSFDLPQGGFYLLWFWMRSLTRLVSGNMAMVLYPKNGKILQCLVSNATCSTFLVSFSVKYAWVLFGGRMRYESSTVSSQKGFCRGRGGEGERENLKFWQKRGDLYFLNLYRAGVNFFRGGLKIFRK